MPRCQQSCTRRIFIILSRNLPLVFVVKPPSFTVASMRRHNGTFISVDINGKLVQDKLYCLRRVFLNSNVLHCRIFFSYAYCRTVGRKIYILSWPVGVVMPCGYTIAYRFLLDPYLMFRDKTLDIYSAYRKAHDSVISFLKVYIEQQKELDSSILAHRLDVDFHFK